MRCPQPPAPSPRAEGKTRSRPHGSTWGPHPPAPSPSGRRGEPDSNLTPGPSPNPTSPLAQRNLTPHPLSMARAIEGPYVRRRGSVGTRYSASACRGGSRTVHTTSRARHALPCSSTNQTRVVCEENKRTRCSASLQIRSLWGGWSAYSTNVTVATVPDCRWTAGGRACGGRWRRCRRRTDRFPSARG